MKYLLFSKIVRTIIKFLDFVKHVLKEWIFWIFFLPNIVTLVIQYYSKTFQLPQFLYFLVPIVGFLIACYKVFRNLESKLNIEIVPNPSLMFTLVEGNEYSFLFDSPYESFEGVEYIRELESKKTKEFHYEDEILIVEGEPQYWFPKINLSINFRIENNGNLPIDILRLITNFTIADFIPFRLYNQKNQINNKEVVFPIHLDPTEFQLFQVTCNIAPEEMKVITLAQIAVAMKKFNKTISINLKTDTQDKNGGRKEYIFKFDVSFRPFVDSFVSQIHQYRQSEIIRLFETSK